MKFIYHNIFAIFFVFALELAADYPKLIPTSEKFCQEISNLPTKGVLYQKDNGEILLKVSDEYCEKLCPFIDVFSNNYVKASSGAHISVFRPVFDRVQLSNIPELGQEFSFHVMGFGEVVPVSDKYCYVWLLMVHSPELTNLRLKYGLEPYLHGDHAFHIALGYQPIQ